MKIRAALALLVVGFCAALVHFVNQQAMLWELQQHIPEYSAENVSPDTPENAFRHFECARCHADPQHDVPLLQSCVGCHQRAFAGEFDALYSDAKTSKWRRNLVHLNWAPSLELLNGRLQRSWVVRYLQNPHPVRPTLGAVMPKLPITSKEAELLADYLQLLDSPNSGGTAPGNRENGARIFTAKRCSSCHSAFPDSTMRYGSSELKSLTPSVRRAPDLRFTVQRMSADQLGRFLADPASVNPNSLMPKIPLDPSEVHDLVAYLSTLDSPPAPTIPRPLRLLNRPVSFDEIQTKLTGHLCFHCHSDSNRQGDKGPGHSGGFGYRGVRLDLFSAEGAIRGRRGPSGKFMGIHERMPDGTPRLIASLLARYTEMSGDYSGPVLGMPLGLLPLPEEDIELIWSWIEQRGGSSNSPD